MIDIFIPNEKLDIMKVESTEIDNGLMFIGAQIDNNFDIFNVIGSGISRKDAIIAFKYLQKFDLDSKSLEAFRVNENEIDEDDEQFVHDSI